ncbi:MAG: SIS domain-containing protein [Acidimicrobiia bacterium]|nr:SIS domain-containing protein [Acidimicrobiia bacterium]
MAVVRRRTERPAPRLADLGAELDAAFTGLSLLVRGEPQRLAAGLAEVACAVEDVDAHLRGVAGCSALVADGGALADLVERVDALAGAVTTLDAMVDSQDVAGRIGDVEEVNAALVRVKDAVWSLSGDRLRGAEAVRDLAGRDAGLAAIECYASIQIALAALDRLEVRGRDSAGLHVLVVGHGLDLDDPAVTHLIGTRGDDPLFAARSVRVDRDYVSIVYKTAVEIGELGDNTTSLRAQVRGDELLRRALDADDAQTTVLAHTRWASVGMISEPNAHPLDSYEEDGTGASHVVAALNGDVDNYADLEAVEGLRIPAEIATDAKVIPVLVARRIAAGLDVTEAFRSTVSSFEGSVAVAVQVAADPDKTLLALRGSGQALYVGLAEDAFVVSSEPYGLVGEAHEYLRLDGESPADAGDPGTRGQIVVLDRAKAGSIQGVHRYAYDGRDLPVGDGEWQLSEITTRDVDRGDHPHYLLKELMESPRSFRKTLRGRIVAADGGLCVRLPPEAISADLMSRLQNGDISRVAVVGQGTAAVAGRSLASALREQLGSTPVRVEAIAATELSGFGLSDDMSDTLVVAISQSGTTTDTNRTVDVVRERGAAVISIVNRRQSDLVDKSDGVLYTSDGRDVEMAVPSTKAFYAQIAAGFLLAFALADALCASGRPAVSAEARTEMLAGLRDLPDAMEEVLRRREAIEAAARAHAPSRRHWAIVGNGPNRIAAAEVRIKLSELCYKSIACDLTEDKKHIDLSAEPLILVCAAGLSGSTADDVAKELAIYRAHKAAPIAIVSDDEVRFDAALDTLRVPVVHTSLAFVLSAMVGHLFGYEAALAIDASARPLRGARGRIEAIATEAEDGDELLQLLVSQIEPFSGAFFDTLRAGGYDGQLEAGTAVRVASILRYATGVIPLDAYAVEHGRVGTPSTLVEDLTEALTDAIDELTRPVDAIKHQAKTVTVGVSRSDESLLRVPLVQQLIATGVDRDRLSYRSLRTLVDLDTAVAAVTGYTRYRIEGDPAAAATIQVVDRGGVAVDIPSRTSQQAGLRGTKHRVASEREVTVVRGRADGRTIVAVPEVKANQATGIVLLHVRFHDRLAPEAARRVLQGYRGRYEAIRDQVTETEPVFSDEILGEIDLVELLTEPVASLADRWRTS